MPWPPFSLLTFFSAGYKEIEAGAGRSACGPVFCFEASDQLSAVSYQLSVIR